MNMNLNYDSNMIIKKKIPDIAFTHSGKFHADDVFAAALLTYLNPHLQIIRGNSVPADFNGIVFDIGGGEFDHHQTDRKLREDGTPYAAFGLLWKEFGGLILDGADAIKFDEDFIKPIDFSDNTGCHYIISSIIEDFNPSWDSDENPDEAFDKAKVFALTILYNRFENIKSVKRAEGMVLAALEQMEDNILILPRSAPWKSYVDASTVEFVIYPSNRGGFNAQGVPDPKQEDQKTLKIYFPEEWAGLRDSELEKTSGITGLRFCHNSLFLVAADTIEAAYQACKKAQNQWKLRNK